MNASNFKKRLGPLALLVGATLSTRAGAIDFVPNYVGSGTNGWSLAHGFDYTYDYDGTLSANRKYIHLQGENAGGTGYCFDIETSGMDTVFWTFQNATSGNTIQLSDDQGPGYGSKARIWNTAGSWVIKIATYNSSLNDSAFTLRVIRMDTTEATCTTNSGLPWMKVTTWNQATFGNL